MDYVISTLAATMAPNDTVSSQAEDHNPHCTNRSEWRLLPGKPPERLSPYYQLACDFGSSLIASWGTEEGTEPIYLCEGHAKQFLSSVANRASAGSVARHKEREKEAKPGPVAGSQKASPAPPAPGNTTRDPHRKPTTPEQSLADRCVAIDRQISELASQMENILSQSEATIDAVSTIDAPLEQAILEIIGNPAMSETQKDAAITRLGELQKSLKQGAGQRMTLLEAHRIQRSLAGCLSGNFGVSDEAKPGYRAVHDGLEEAIHAALSESAIHLVSA